MTDEQTDEIVDGGDKDNKDTEKDSVPEEAISPLDRAEAANKEKEKLLEREEKIIERKEKLAEREERIIAEELVGGRAEAGGETKPKEESPADYAKKVMANDL